jgi:hypothetical protein
MPDSPFRVELYNTYFSVSGNSEHMKRVVVKGPYEESTKDGITTRVFQKKFSFVDFREMGQDGDKKDIIPKITVESKVDPKYDDGKISGYAYPGTAVDKYSGIYVPSEANVSISAPNATINEAMPGFARRNTLGFASEYSDQYKNKSLDLNSDGYTDFIVYMKNK